MFHACYLRGNSSAYASLLAAAAQLLWISVTKPHWEYPAADVLPNFAAGSTYMELGIHHGREKYKLDWNSVVDQ